MRDYEEQAPIAFIHVPKSGGTTLRAVFAAWLLRPPPLQLSLANFLPEIAPTLMDHLPFDLTLGNYRRADRLEQAY